MKKAKRLQSLTLFNNKVLFRNYSAPHVMRKSKERVNYS